MSEIANAIRGVVSYTIDLDRPLVQVSFGSLAEKDADEYLYEVKMERNGAEANLGSAGAMVYMVLANRETLSWPGTVEGNYVRFTIPENCHDVRGRFLLSVTVSVDGATRTVLRADGAMVPKRTDNMSTPAVNGFPTYEEMLEILSKAEKATSDANKAAATANTAAGTIDDKIAEGLSTLKSETAIMKSRMDGALMVDGSVLNLLDMSTAFVGQVTDGGLGTSKSYNTFSIPVEGGKSYRFYKQASGDINGSMSTLNVIRYAFWDDEKQLLYSNDNTSNARTAPEGATRMYACIYATEYARYGELIMGICVTDHPDYRSGGRFVPFGGVEYVKVAEELDAMKIAQAQLISKLIEKGIITEADMSWPTEALATE